MGICSRCSMAVQHFRPHNGRQHEVESRITAVLPRWGDTMALKCWICNKFSKWLETQDRGTFMKWQIEALDVEYAAVAYLFFIDRAPEGAQPQVSMSVFPPGHTKDSGCWIDLCFLYVKGECVFTPLQRLSARARDGQLLTRRQIRRHRPWYRVG